MRTKEITLLAILAIAAISLYNLSSNTESKEQAMFNVWMDMHGKQYADLGERSYRLGIWLENYQFVREHNSKY